MTLRIPTTTLRHTAENNYRCADLRCPCQSAGITDPTLGPTHWYALKPGSTDCAWCNDEAGRPQPQGKGRRGICQRHSDELRARAKARKVRGA